MKDIELEDRLGRIERRIARLEDLGCGTDSPGSSRVQCVPGLVLNDIEEIRECIKRAETSC